MASIGDQQRSQRGYPHDLTDVAGYQEHDRREQVADEEREKTERFLPPDGNDCLKPLGIKGYAKHILDIAKACLRFGNPVESDWQMVRRDANAILRECERLSQSDLTTRMACARHLRTWRKNRQQELHQLFDEEQECRKEMRHDKTLWHIHQLLQKCERQSVAELNDEQEAARVDKRREVNMKVKCNGCGYVGDESEFPKRYNFFQHSYIASCPKCKNRQSPGKASMRMCGGKKPFEYVRDEAPDESAT